MAKYSGVNVLKSQRKELLLRNPSAGPAYQCPLARRNQKLDHLAVSVGVYVRVRVPSLPVAHCSLQIVNDPRPRPWRVWKSKRTPKTIPAASSIVASPALVAAALTSSSIPPWLPFFFEVRRRFRAYSRFVILSIQCRHYRSCCQCPVVIAAPNVPLCYGD